MGTDSRLRLTARMNLGELVFDLAKLPASLHAQDHLEIEVGEITMLELKAVQI